MIAPGMGTGDVSRTEGGTLARRGTGIVATEGFGMTSRIIPLDYHPPDPKPTEDRPPAFSDEALALRFAARHAADLRYVAPWSRWMIWDGRRWLMDDSLHAFDRARSVCREAAAECNEPKVASAIASAKTVAAVERLARSDRRIAARTDQWDKDIWLLNTPDGVVDLLTGSCRPHRPDDYQTRMTSVGTRGTCPEWLGFLERITGGDPFLQSYLKRVAGYVLTGSTKEHALFFVYGTGANGKSVFMNTIACVIGDYHRNAPIETFTSSLVERHPTELASLRGARLVTAIETEEGRRWAEARIKTLTGGDTISARFMRQDFFDYLPQFKLIIAGNHLPSLRSVDEAISRRFNVIPFAVTISSEEREPNLSERLKAEWPGILAWMIEGCVEWQKSGLAPPEAVTAATTAYLEAEDAVLAWIDECCERDPGSWSASNALYTSWKAWADKIGEYAGSSKGFGQTLEARGFPRRRRMNARGYLGLRVKQAA